MLEFSRSKREVLTQFYIREIPLLIHKITERRKLETLAKLYEQQMALLTAVATAGSCASKESIESISNSIRERIEELSDKKPGGPDHGTNEGSEDPYEKLMQLQNTIAQNNPRKRKR